MNISSQSHRRFIINRPIWGTVEAAYYNLG